MLRGLRTPALAVLVLALTGGQAHAVTYDFSVSPTVPNEDQVTTFRLTPTSAEVNQVRWDLDGDGALDDGTTRTVQRVYANRGTVRVTVRAREDNGDPFQFVTKTIVVNGAPTVDFTYEPGSPLVGQEVGFSAQGSDAEGDSITFAWRFGDGDTATGPAPSHAYDDDGTYAVELTATDEHGAFATKTVPVPVAEDPGPEAGFDIAPAAPVTGETVTFTSTSTPSHGSLTALDWDLDGDGAFDDGSGPSAARSYAVAGTYPVGLRVEQANGKASVAFADVTVAAAPPPPPPPDAPGGSTVVGPSLILGPPAPARRLVLMRPFPVVRIAGVVLRNGADIRILSIRAPRGARIRVRCRGRGCPAAGLARTSATRLVRLRRFERRLPAGISLELFVRKAGTIGKYTRFTIRAGKPPARVDRCLIPGRERPVPCS
jgi:PKD repeat protein